MPRLLGLALALTPIAIPNRVAAAELPKGTIIERVASTSDPSRSYALYLPSSLDPSKKAPLLYVFDPAGRGALAAELFREGAERNGWIIVSSNDTRSDNDWEPNRRAVAALWNEPQAKGFPVDERRVYAAGFSGGAVLAWAIGLDTGRFAGIIASGGRLPDELSPPATIPFAWFGAAGTTDFNFPKMHALDELLEKKKAPRRLEIFEGTHQWMPAHLAAEAIDWMELLAMRGGKRPADEGFINLRFRGALERVRALEREAKLLESLRLARATIRTFENLVEVAPLREIESRLAATETLKSAIRAERAALDYEAAYESTIFRTLAGLAAADSPPAMPRLVSALRIEELEQKSQLKNGAEAAAARRVLERLFTQASYYFWKEMVERKRWDLGATALTLALRIHEHDARVWYDLACAHARNGSTSRALEALGRAIDEGFHDDRLMATDPDLASIRNEKQFRRLARRIGAP